MTTRLSEYATATLLEASPEVTAFPGGLKPLFRPVRVAGPAFPVESEPGDNLAVHLALAEIPPGYLLVVATRGATHCGFWGEILAEAAIARQVVGLVTDGAIRDTREIRALGFPVFSAGVAIPGTVKKSPGRVNQPIRIGSCPVGPGDFVVADDDGIVVVPSGSEQDVMEKAQARVDREEEIIRRLREGELTVDLLGLRGNSSKGN